LRKGRARRGLEVRDAASAGIRRRARAPNGRNQALFARNPEEIPRFCTLFLQFGRDTRRLGLCKNGIRISVPIWAQRETAFAAVVRACVSVMPMPVRRSCKCAPFGAPRMFALHLQPVNELASASEENQKQTSRIQNSPESWARTKSPVGFCRQAKPRVEATSC
jgi:hypothetical protein